MLACLSDVHSNLPALEAALADARAQGATRRLLGGDHALSGGWPAEPAARLCELDDAIGAVERPVEYDHGAAVHRLRSTFGDAPWARSTAARLEQARFDAA